MYYFCISFLPLYPSSQCSSYSFIWTLYTLSALKFNLYNSYEYIYYWSFLWIYCQSLKAFWIFRNLFTLYTQVYEFVRILDSFAYCLYIRNSFSFLFQRERAQFGYRRNSSTLGRRLDLGLGLGLVLLAALTVRCLLTANVLQELWI